MSNYELTIAYQTDRSMRDAAAYRIAISPTADELHRFRQVGEVYNDVVRYRGVFATEMEARQMVKAYRGR